MSIVSPLILVPCSTLAQTPQQVPSAGEAPATGTPQNNVTVLGAPSAPVQSSTGGTPTTGQPLPTPVPGAPQNTNSLMLFAPLMVLMVVMILVSVFQGRKERKRQAELMTSIKRHDEVVTTSGIVGTVADVTDDYVVVKVEDGRIRFMKRSIAQVLKVSAGSSGGATTVVESKSAPKEGRETVRA